jgi:hypothetical protein
MGPGQGAGPNAGPDRLSPAFFSGHPRGVKRGQEERMAQKRVVE